MSTRHDPQPAVWFPAVRAGSGTDVFTEQLAADLRRRGLRAEITWLPLRAEYSPWTVPVPLPPPWANVVHINSWLHPRFVPEGLPIIVTVHHSVHDPTFSKYKSPAQKLYHRFWIRRIEAYNLKHSSIVTAVSRHVATQIEKEFGGRDAIVIHNGIDVEKTFTPGPPRDPHQPFRLLYVGNWILRKGVDLLAPILQRLGHEFELLYTADRAGAHKHYKMPSNTRCLGRVPPPLMPQIYRDADALIFPSRSEGLPLGVIEAQACGLPVIAADIPPLSEVIHHGVTGFLCPVDDVNSFAQMITALRTDKAEWLGMRRAAHKRALKLFSMENQAQKYIDCYVNMLAKDPIVSSSTYRGQRFKPTIDR